MSVMDIRLDESFIIAPEPQRPGNEAIVALLDGLYTAESRSFFRYMETWSPYTTAATMKLRTAVRGMMRRSFEHADRLAKLVESLGGVTTPGAFAESNSHANYTSWANLMPRLLASKQDTVSRYAVAILRLNDAVADEAAKANIRRELAAMLDEHRADLATLQDWGRRLAS